MSDPSDPLAWVAKAEEDWRLARASIRLFRKISAYGACFHAQQCAEKYLKALLVAQGARFSKVHDLRRLQEECEAAGVIVAVNVNQLDLLTHYAVQVRYPGDDPSANEAREAVKIARAVRKFSRKYLGVK